MIRYVPHYTVADYEQWDGDWELWDGAAVSLTPSPFGLHQYVAVNFASELRSALRKSDSSRAYVLSEIDWRISSNTAVRPDVVLVDGIPDRHLDRPPILIGEVLSDATADKDRTAKLELYQQQGVVFYLILDPTQKSIDGFELDAAGQYQPMLFSSDLVASGHGTDVRIPLSAIFD